MIYEFMRDLVRLLSVIILGRRLRIEGMENIPRTGAALIVGNHVGAVDPVLLGIHIPRRDVYYMAKSELFRRRFLGWLFRSCHTFPVVRDSPDRTALKTALDHLARGRLLLVYPEGTRRDDGGEAIAHAGAGFIARRAGVPIVPVASWGSDKVIPRGVHLPRRADVGIRIGAPFRLPSLGARGRPIGNQEAADHIMARVRPLLPVALRGHRATTSVAHGPTPAT